MFKYILSGLLIHTHLIYSNQSDMPSILQENFVCGIQCNQIIYPSHKYSSFSSGTRQDSEHEKQSDQKQSNTSSTAFEYAYPFATNEDTNNQDFSRICGLIAYNFWPLIYKPAKKQYLATYRSVSYVDSLTYTVKIYAVANIQQQSSFGLHSQILIKKDFILSTYLMINQKLWSLSYVGAIISYANFLYIHVHNHPISLQDETKTNTYALDITQIDLTIRITHNFSVCLKNYYTTLSNGESTFTERNLVSLLGFQHLYKFKKIYALFECTWEWPFHHYWFPYISLSFSYNNPYDHSVLMHNHFMQDPVIQMLSAKTQELIKKLEEESSKEYNALVNEHKDNLLRIFQEQNTSQRALISELLTEDDKIDEVKFTQFYRRSFLQYHPDKRQDAVAEKLSKTLSALQLDGLTNTKKEFFVKTLQEFRASNK